ncbi:MAG: hypothetical protein K0V04_40030 [Deltaproteobacteria bacterium]|nr:hypothetical protein [Deltaproteobacteria bacterium]
MPRPEDGAPVAVKRHHPRHRTDVNLAVATLAFRQRPMRLAAADLAAPLRCRLFHGGDPLGICNVIDVSSGGLGIALPPELPLWLGMGLDEVRLEQRGTVVAQGPAEVVNLLDGTARRAGLRLMGGSVELSRLSLRDGSPADPGGATPAAATLPADWRAAVSEFGQLLRWSGFFLDQATRSLGERLSPAQERAVFSDFFAQWAPRALGALGRLHDLSAGLDAEQHEAARLHARHHLAADIHPGQVPEPPAHGAIDDHALPLLFSSAEFDDSTLHARFLRYAWPRFPLVRTILARPRWLGDLWDALRVRADARVLVVQPGPAAELTEVQLLGGRRVELTLLETDGHTRAEREPGWRERWLGPAADLHVGGRPPTGMPAADPDEVPYDLIYGAGVLAGLRDADARALIRSLYARLRPQGRMVLGNLGVEPATTWLLDHVLGWRLHYRDAPALRELAKSLELRATAVEVGPDPTGRATILDVVR